MITQTKHIGKHNSEPCVILYREVPNEPNNCLITLPVKLGEAKQLELMMIVNGIGAQSEDYLPDVFKRVTFSDGENVLDFLHYNGYIIKVPTDSVIVTPTSNGMSDYSLRTVNEEIRKLESRGSQASAADAPDSASDDDSAAEPTQDEIAAGLLVQGNLMIEDAEKLRLEGEAKRVQAFKLSPELETSPA